MRCVTHGGGYVIAYLTCYGEIWCEEGYATKRKQFKGDTKNYYEIHAINSDKAIGIGQLDQIRESGGKLGFGRPCTF